MSASTIFRGRCRRRSAACGAWNSWTWLTTASLGRCQPPFVNCRGFRTSLIRTITSPERRRSAADLVAGRFPMGGRIVFQIRVIRGRRGSVPLMLLSHLTVASLSAVVAEPLLRSRVGGGRWRRILLRLSRLVGLGRLSGLLHRLRPRRSLHPVVGRTLHLLLHHQPSLSNRRHLLTKSLQELAFHHLHHRLTNM